MVQILDTKVKREVNLRSVKLEHFVFVHLKNIQLIGLLPGQYFQSHLSIGHIFDEDVLHHQMAQASQGPEHEATRP